MLVRSLFDLEAGGALRYFAAIILFSVNLFFNFLHALWIVVDKRFIKWK